MKQPVTQRLPTFLRSSQPYNQSSTSPPATKVHTDHLITKQLNGPQSCVRYDADTHAAMRPDSIHLDPFGSWRPGYDVNQDARPLPASRLALAYSIRPVVIVLADLLLRMPTCLMYLRWVRGTHYIESQSCHTSNTERAHTASLLHRGTGDTYNPLSPLAMI